jgi:hypothetical protein
MRCDVDVQPGKVKTWPVIDGNGAEEGAEELDPIGSGAQDQDVADDAGDVGEEDKGAADPPAVGEGCGEEEAQASANIYGDRHVLGLQAVVAQALNDGWKEGREAVEKDVLAELDGTTERGVLADVYML